jgi:hypothetical protein
VAGVATAVLRQFMLLRSRLGWSTTLVVGLCAMAFIQSREGVKPGVELTAAYAGAFWPALVWMDERGRRGDWDESVPLGRVPLRMAHALAGVAWLVIALAPGALLHPSGFALLAATLVLYLASTAAAALLGRPVLACFIAAPATSFAGFVLAPGHPLSLAHALAPFDAPDGIEWSLAAWLLWASLFAAAAAAALHLQARRDRSGGTWLPRLRRAAHAAHYANSA